MHINLDLRLDPNRNRCQFWLTLPISLVVSSLYGYQLAETGAIDVMSGIIAGAFGLSMFVYVQLLLEPWVVDKVTDDSGRFEEAAAFIWDASIGAAVGLPFFWYIGVAPVPALAGAAAVGAGYGYGAGWIMCGGGVEAVVGGITGGLGGAPRKPEYSEIEAMEASGNYLGAASGYARVLADDPQNVRLAVKRAQLLARRLDDVDGAMDVMLGTIQSGKTPPDSWAYAVRVLIDIAARDTDRLEIGLAELKRLAAAHPRAESATWARNRARVLKGELAELREERTDEPDDVPDEDDPPSHPGLEYTRDMIDLE